MGLDMYLSKRYYVKNWDHMKDSEKHQITILKGGKPSSIPVDKISEITIDVGYWRKANHIHKWFVDNVQDGVDDCRDSYVSEEKLKELLEICKKVVNASELVDGEIENGKQFVNGEMKSIMVNGKTIKDPSVAKELLPTEDGFFFGSTDYNEYYLSDVKETINIIMTALNGDDGTIYYHSSW